MCPIIQPRSARVSVRRRIMAAAATSAVLLTAACGAESSDADSSEDAIELEIVAFSPPSLGAFLPAVIAEERFDLDNGLDITFVERPPDAYNTEIGTGQYQNDDSITMLKHAVNLIEVVDVDSL